MSTDADEVKLRLLESDEEFRQLTAQHQDLDQRLNSLYQKKYFEQSEETTLKKQKLALKDRMEDILRRHRDLLHPPSPAPSSAGSSARG